MLHPLFHLITTQPQLLGDHAQAYGELISSELAAQADALKRRTLFGALALCFLGVAIVLAGVALMLWATLVQAPAQSTLWILVLVPAAPAALALACYLLASSSSNADEPAFAELRRQVQADVDLLRSMGT